MTNGAGANGNNSDIAAKLRCSFRLGRTKKSSASSQSLTTVGLNSYRFGSVSHDTQLCLWDLTGNKAKSKKEIALDQYRLLQKIC